MIKLAQKTKIEENFLSMIKDIYEKLTKKDYTPMVEEQMFSP
jgi:hypothetical protein